MISCREQQEEIDKLYMNFCNTLSHEMDIYLKYVDSPKTIRQTLKSSKPYWNQDLYDLWIKMSRAEMAFSKFRGPRHIRENVRGNLYLTEAFLIKL